MHHHQHQHQHHHRHRREGATSMRYALTRHLQLGSVRDLDWVAANFGHR